MRLFAGWVSPLPPQDRRVATVSWSSVGDGGDERAYVVTVGACARDDEVFEVKSRGIAPVSASTFWKAPPPKWMIEKGLASAPPATSDDEKEECARDE